MIKELWYWSWEAIKDVCHFEFRHARYDVINLWWLLRYGFTLSDVQDLDRAIIYKLRNMLVKYMEVRLDCGSPEEEAGYKESMQNFLAICSLLCDGDKWEDMTARSQNRVQSEFFELLNKHFFGWWI